jgi:hypothetical protein
MLFGSFSRHHGFFCLAVSAYGLARRKPWWREKSSEKPVPSGFPFFLLRDAKKAFKIYPRTKRAMWLNAALSVLCLLFFERCESGVFVGRKSQWCKKSSEKPVPSGFLAFSSRCEEKAVEMG